MRAWDLPQGAVAAFEIDVDALVDRDPGAAMAEDLTTFPALLQDIAVVAADDVPAAMVEEVVRGAGGDLLRSVRVFDVYRGEQVGDGRRSLAFAVRLQASDRTLTDEDVADVRRRLIDAVQSALPAALRG